MSHYSGLKMTLAVQRETRSYLQLLYIVAKLRYLRFTVPLVRSLGYCAERIRGDFLNAVSYGCNSDSRTVSLLLLSESLHNNNKYLSISFTAHLGGRQFAEELLSAVRSTATRIFVRISPLSILKRVRWPSTVPGRTRTIPR